MNLFTTIEGLSGENLTSALLRYLMINSPEVRGKIVDFLSTNSPIGPLVSMSHFSCETEFPTEHEKLGTGRIDLLIILDDTIIAIENKINASFQPGQPEKYQTTLETMKEHLSKIRRSKLEHFTMLLCPKSREKEARIKINSLERTVYASWENLFGELKSLDNLSDSVSQVILKELLDYLRQFFDFIPEFPTLEPHLRKNFDTAGTALQRKIVGRLWNFFPGAGKRLSFGDTWVGYYFMGGETGHLGWYGFIKQSELLGQEIRPSELIVASTYVPTSLSSEDFKAVKLKNDNFIGRPNNTHAWIVNFDKTWDSNEKWRKAFEPFREPFDKVLNT
jgi:hypothetical protein